MKCQVCARNDVEWSWQPAGPGEDARCFTLPGSHYRGFPVVKVCDHCKQRIEYGKTLLHFMYKDQTYRYYDGQIEKVNSSNAPF